MLAINYMITYYIVSHSILLYYHIYLQAVKVQPMLEAVDSAMDRCLEALPTSAHALCVCVCVCVCVCARCCRSRSGHCGQKSVYTL